MASKQPTCQQLAYLDELKQRLQELRLRQETFIEETAVILRNISSDRPVQVKVVPSTKSVVLPVRCEEEHESAGNIKQLIQQFEDLRKTSKQFSDQAMPEELLGVDVRKLLKGYENLIMEGNILHKNWMLLKKTTESCARQEYLNEDLPRTKSEATTQRQYYNIQTNRKLFEKLAKSPSKFVHKIRRTNYSNQIKFGVGSKKLMYPEHEGKTQYSENDRRQRFGALLQLIFRVSPFNKCSMRKTISEKDVRKSDLNK
ncbi:uncharacterized protein LOC117565544 [Drosophila albomicans]|uniref:Uncharacterized protein LOC117565544 n=1 Tax=Drosophila albomicans TaxID=7291 RepID=A0A6P8WA55_DROAB|nr:uncharacterized protein LOC117565544 [Drosophila albomicans]